MSNFNKQPNPTAYVKFFNTQNNNVIANTISWIYSTINGQLFLTNAPSNSNVQITNDLYVEGTAHLNHLQNNSDISLKENIVDLSSSREEIVKDIQEKVMLLKPKQYTMKTDITHKKHYGFIAQDVETLFPEIVGERYINNQPIKTVNYLELVPLILLKVQDLQEQIDQMKE